VLCSESAGVEKPSPAFFARVIAEAAAPAREIAYVGDRLDNDVLPAMAAGMRGILLRRGPGHHARALPEAARADARIETLVELPDALEKPPRARVREDDARDRLALPRPARDRERRLRRRAARARLAGAVEVTLRAPAPLATELEVLEGADGARTLVLAGRELARAVRSALALEVPSAPPVDLVAAHAGDCRAMRTHPFPEDFVCGPARAPGDGLRIFPGVVPGSDLVAALWFRTRRSAPPTGAFRRDRLGGARQPLFVSAARAESARALEPMVLGRLCVSIEGARRRGAGAGDGVAARARGRRHAGARSSPQGALRRDRARDLVSWRAGAVPRREFRSSLAAEAPRSQGARARRIG
jgi:hypothetical protein